MINKPQERSLYFAPMEGITDETYRLAIYRAFPEWDYYFTDFLRTPTVGTYPKNHIQEHFGSEIYKNPELKDKTVYQILTSTQAKHVETAISIAELGFSWLDLNLGCPSKTVTGNKGGSYLLLDLINLRTIVKDIRNNFPHRFTCKIRVGFYDDKNLESIVHLLQDEGVEAITIHARTKEQMYKGIADWNYLKRAVKIAKVPIVGNGDIWTAHDLDKMFNEVGCHSAMMARGALKSPWLAKLYKEKNFNPALHEELYYVCHYFKNFVQVMQERQMPAGYILKRLKSVSRYIFDIFPDHENLKRNFMRTQSTHEAYDFLEQLPKCVNISL